MAAIEEAIAGMTAEAQRGPDRINEWRKAVLADIRSLSDRAVRDGAGKFTGEYEHCIRFKSEDGVRALTQLLFGCSSTPTPPAPDRPAGTGPERLAKSLSQRHVLRNIEEFTCSPVYDAAGRLTGSTMSLSFNTPTGAAAFVEGVTGIKQSQ